jgi:hypothetical protein
VRGGEVAGVGAASVKEGSRYGLVMIQLPSVQQLIHHWRGGMYFFWKMVILNVFTEAYSCHSSRAASLGREPRRVPLSFGGTSE